MAIKEMSLDLSMTQIKDKGAKIAEGRTLNICKRWLHGCWDVQAS